MFHCGLIGFQKIMFVILKMIFVFGSSHCNNPIVAMSIPLNICSIALTIIFAAYKLNDLNRKKKNEDTLKKD